MIEYLLHQAMKEGHVLSVYTDKEDTDHFAAGFIQRMTEQYVLIAHVSPFGMYDGYVLKYRADIYRVEYQGQYENKVEQLYRLRHQKHNKVENRTDSLIEDLLNYAYENGVFVSIEINNSGYKDVHGKVQTLQNETVVIRQIDESGNPDGETAINLQDISLVTCDSDEEIAMRLLFEEKKKTLAK